MIELITTVESLAQAGELLPFVDTIYFGEETFGLRLPQSFSREEQRELVAMAHQAGKKAAIAVNGIMHPAEMELIPEYLAFIKSIGADRIVIGDPGVAYVMLKDPTLRLPFVYDGATLVTNARQINFWQKKGAVGAVLAREVPFGEMQLLAPEVTLPVEVLVYGATCIHHSKRPLLQNYYRYTQQDEAADRKRDLFLSEPKKADTHYSIYEDRHGTHIFADNDLNLIRELPELVANGFKTWKLDGVLAPGENFVTVAKAFDRARNALEDNSWSPELATELDATIQAHHPQNRGLDTGFYYLDPNDIK